VLATRPRRLSNRSLVCLGLVYEDRDFLTINMHSGARLAMRRSRLPALGRNLVLIQLAEVFVAIETGDWMTLERAWLARVHREANHCLVTN